MEGRSFKIENGEDQDPIYDLTEPTENVHVIWEEMEVGGRAWKGESDVGTVPIRDERGETGQPISLPAGLSEVHVSAHNRWYWQERHGSNTMARGWVGPKDYRRTRQGGLAADRHRELVASMFDANEQLKGIIVDDNRPEELDTTRVEWLRDTYLSGLSRPTTVISNTYLATGSNTVTLPAQRVTGDPKSVLEEIANLANKEFFVTVDEELFYDGWDSTAYTAGVRISDRPDEIDTTIETGCDVTDEVATAPHTLFHHTNAGEWRAMTISGENRLLVAFVASNATKATGTAVTSVKWRPESNPPIADPVEEYTKIATRVGADGREHTIWVLWNPTPTSGSDSGNTFITNSSGLRASFGVIAVQGLSSDPTGSLLTALNDGTSASPSVTIADAGTDVLVLSHGMAFNSTASITATGTDMVELRENISGGVGPTSAEIDKQESQTGAVTASWTLGASEDWHAALVSIPTTDAGVDGAGLPTFPPIWDVGPAATEDGKQLLSGLRLYYGQGSNTYVYRSDPVTANRHGHYEEALYAPPNITTAAQANLLADTIIARRKYEDRNINCSIGPMTIDPARCLKYGQLIYLKARPITFADDFFFRGRIRQLRWTTPAPGMFFAHLMIERPIKDVPYGVGNRSGSEAITGHLAQGSNSHTEFVLKSTLTTQGDLPYRGASDWTRLGIGASNTVLKSIGTVPVWATTSDAGVTDHGGLTGLTDDDHQYVRDRSGGEELVNTVAASGSSLTLDLADGNAHDVTLTANCTFTFTGATNGVACSFALLLRQDGTGSRTVTWPGSVVWREGTVPTLSSDPGDTDSLTFYTLDGGTTWFGFLGAGGGGTLDGHTDVTITSATLDDDLRYNGSAWVNDSRKWEAVTNGEDVFVWVGDDLVHEWSS